MSQMQKKKQFSLSTASHISHPVQLRSDLAYNLYYSPLMACLNKVWKGKRVQALGIYSRSVWFLKTYIFYDYYSTLFFSALELYHGAHCLRGSS